MLIMEIKLMATGELEQPGNFRKAACCRALSPATLNAAPAHKGEERCACAQQVPVMVGLLSLTVLMSMLAIHEKHGGRKVLGVLAPIVGSGLIVSGIGWLAIASCALSDPLPIGVTVAPADVPSVIEFWNMIVFPTSSKAVGVFGAGDKFLVIGDAKYSLDRVTCMFFWIVFFLFGMRYQTKGDGGISVLTGAQRNLQDLNDQLEQVQANTRGLGTMK